MKKPWRNHQIMRVLPSGTNSWRSIILKKISAIRMIQSDWSKKYVGGLTDSSPARLMTRRHALSNTDSKNNRKDSFERFWLLPMGPTILPNRSCDRLHSPARFPTDPIHTPAWKPQQFFQVSYKHSCGQNGINFFLF